LLVDRFETTRADWKAWYESLGARRDPQFEPFLSTWKSETGHWPASFMTLLEAREYAASRGMRLLTAREWLRVACGTSERPYDYPWGGKRALSVANTLELELRNPLPVGTFEQGRNPLSIYDLSGNVWEWVEDSLAVGANSSGLSWAMGGSYLSHLRRLYDDSQEPMALDEQDLDPLTRCGDVGLRCCADAEEYLWSHAAQWSGRNARDALLAVGASWGRDAIPLLEELTRRPAAPESLSLLLAGARR
jgi:formylglycine-generating enzyme required for sulfatase activity